LRAVQQPLNRLRSELTEYSGDYRFVKTFLENCPADYERFRYIEEKDVVRIVFKATKSDYCFK